MLNFKHIQENIIQSLARQYGQNGVSAQHNANAFAEQILSNPITHIMRKIGRRIRASNHTQAANSVETGNSENSSDSGGDESSGGDDDDDPEPPTEFIHFFKPGEVNEPPEPAQPNPSTFLELALALEHIAQELRKYAPHSVNLTTLSTERTHTTKERFNSAWLRKQAVKVLLLSVAAVTFVWVVESKTLESLSAFISAISALIHVSS